VQKHGRCSFETLYLDDNLDCHDKPRYHRQVELFVAGGGDDLLALTDLAGLLQLCEEIFGYADTAMPDG
jgi:hypothetical protein